MQAKLAIFIIVAVLAAGAIYAGIQKPAINQAPPSEDKNVEYAKPVTLNIGEEVIFTDGMKLKLVEINDSRCKPDVQCIWQGELRGTFSVVGGKIGANAQTFSLGTVTAKTANLAGMTFELKSATDMTMTVTVVPLAYAN